MQFAYPEYLTSTDELAGLLADDTAREELRLYDTSVILRPEPPGYRAEPGLADFRAARIPGASFLDLMGALSARGTGLGFTLPDADQLQAGFRAAGISYDSRVIFYSSSHMMWASRAWWMLKSCGHAQVSVLDGGLAKWQAEGRRTEAGEAMQTYDAGDVAVRLDQRRWVGKDEVLAAMDADDTCTINALSPDVYAGTADMHYGRRGHIPGSRNIPYASVMEDGCLRSARELHALFSAAGVLEKPNIIAYCGGGISATIDALALSLLGHENVSVYDGSMSEWVRDEALPLKEGNAP